jgi:hypothetical protein
MQRETGSHHSPRLHHLPEIIHVHNIDDTVGNERTRRGTFEMSNSQDENVFFWYFVPLDFESEIVRDFTQFRYLILTTKYKSYQI